MTEDGDAKVNGWQSHARPGSERNRLERSAVGAECELGICTAIDVVEDSPWETSLGQTSKVADVDNLGG